VFGLNISNQANLSRTPTSSGTIAPFAVNPVIDPSARTAEIRFALDNQGPRLRIGQAVKLRLFVGDEQSMTAIPEWGPGIGM